MRVIAGTAKGRRLQAGDTQDIRPTSDKVKGALFSILLSRYELDDAVLLDLFAGAGALGIEALSRGAAHVTFVDRAKIAIDALRDNLKHCRFESVSRVVARDIEPALHFLEAEPKKYSGVILDPPYNRGLIDSTLRSLAASEILADDAWVMVEHHQDEMPADSYGDTRTLRLTQSRRYGNTCLTLFSLETPMQTTHPANRVTRAVYAGSFDPITNGHLDIVKRAADVFDEVIVAVATGTSDPKKDRALFTADERVALIQRSLTDLGIRATADKFSGLLVDYCERKDAHVIVRGLRAVSDFEYEFQMAMMNRHMKPGIETFFMTASVAYFYTASRLVKEVVSLGGNVKGLLPDAVHQELIKKLGTKA